MNELDDAPPAAPAGENQSRSRRWWRWAGTAAAIVLAIVVLLFLLWPGTAWWVEHVDGVKLSGKGALAGKDRLEVLDKARGRITAVATGVLAALAIYYTAANARSARETARAAQESVQAALRAADHSEEAQRRTHELTERGQLNDRFTAAVAQLGDTNPAIQLGGVHALAGIADDASRTLRQTCIDVLCAYLRLPYAPDPGPVPDDLRPSFASERTVHDQERIAYRGLREVRHTIIRLIGNHLRLPAEDPRSWRGHDFDFTDVVFDGGDLGDAHFTGGIASFANATFAHDFTFHGAVFSGGYVDFQDAEFSVGAVSFREATFSGGQVSFATAELSRGRIDFEGAEFSGGQVSFWGATFPRGSVSFRGAVFSGGQVSFGRVEFSGSRFNFWGAAFSGGHVDFQGAVFSGSQVNFGSAVFSDGQVSFAGAEFSGGQVDFVVPRVWKVPPVGIPTDTEGRPPAGVSLPEPS